MEVRGSSRIFVNFANIFLSILKAWTVTVVVIECDNAIISRKCIPEIVLSRKKFYQNSASKVANSIIVDILKYLY